MTSRNLQCSNPVRVAWPALCVYIGVRCRRCSGCMKMRQYSWMARAAHEQAFAKRTWFVTLTYGPVRRRAIFAAASAAERDKGPGQRLITAAGTYVTAYAKTLRKRGFVFRSIFVPELHRDGFPHYHGLVHDQVGGPDIAWGDLTSAWSAGFSVVKVVKDANAIRYVTKYLSKAKMGRVRASLCYGAPGLDLVDPDPACGIEGLAPAPGAPPPMRRFEEPSEGGENNILAFKLL